MENEREKIVEMIKRAVEEYSLITSPKLVERVSINILIEKLSTEDLIRSFTEIIEEMSKIIGPVSWVIGRKIVKDINPGKEIINKLHDKLR